MSLASAGDVTLPPRQSTFASLIARLQRAAGTFSQVAARTPENLLAIIPTPMPVPQKSKPRTLLSACTRLATAAAAS
eukprot:CAMPEP_0185447452 /NCGR_PEP_ID=MMETSP1365-20130426/56593_1 /TAXON_ID=38817 /ORGANISM="Gephyrocapsa oceanica, Strain RCC1303" /LENGTH=76 /DNA_ID=CAMNT_0028053349 /DNA_START=271 /DNA_END=504 /DNA_ORIENTATION=-